MEPLSKVVAVMVLLLLTGLAFTGRSIVGAASWCVTRSDASQQALQTALDYACGAGADCTPIQQSGLCFLPNTIQAHASYAFNSYFQRKAMAPGSCDFSGTATVAKTDPSYGSCAYPSSPSTAGGTTPPGGGTTPPGGGTTTPGGGTMPISNIPPPPPDTTGPMSGNTGLTPVGMGPGLSNPPNPNRASMGFPIPRIPFLVSLSLLFSMFVFQPLDVFEV